jgi:hypothetical protein
MGAIWTRLEGKAILPDGLLERAEEHAGVVGFINACGANANLHELVLDTFTGASGARRGRRNGETIESER